MGVHSPEYERERKPGAVAAKAREFRLQPPVMIHNDFAYWPAFYLIDRQGKIRYRFVGETHQGEPRARAIERAIRELLAELASGLGSRPKRQGGGSMSDFAIGIGAMALPKAPLR